MESSAVPSSLKSLAPSGREWRFGWGDGCSVCLLNRWGRRSLLEFQGLDLPPPCTYALRRREDLLDVLVGLAEMTLQIEHALAQASQATDDL